MTNKSQSRAHYDRLIVKLVGEKWWNTCSKDEINKLVTHITVQVTVALQLYRISEILVISNVSEIFSEHCAK